ncbi:unnamed protein product, partial [Acanthoscelides obtectus]
NRKSITVPAFYFRKLTLKLSSHYLIRLSSTDQGYMMSRSLVCSTPRHSPYCDRISKERRKLFFPTTERKSKVSHLLAYQINVNPINKLGLYIIALILHFSSRLLTSSAVLFTLKSEIGRTHSNDLDGKSITEKFFQVYGGWLRLHSYTDESLSTTQHRSNLELTRVQQTMLMTDGIEKCIALSLPCNSAR